MTPVSYVPATEQLLHGYDTCYVYTCYMAAIYGHDTCYMVITLVTCVPVPTWQLLHGQTTVTWSQHLLHVYLLYDTCCMVMTPVFRSGHMVVTCYIVCYVVMTPLLAISSCSNQEHCSTAAYSSLIKQLPGLLAGILSPT